MSQNLKRLQKIEAALEQLLAKEKAYIVWHHKAESREEVIQAAIEAGRYNADTQEAVFIISHIPMKTDYFWNRHWKSATAGTQAQYGHRDHQ